MGMIGTLIGLVQMLQNLDDPSTIGPSMAVALLTTFYGAVMANMFFIPVCEKMKIRSAEESKTMQLIIEGIDSIVRGENVMITKEKLEAFLSPLERAGGQERRRVGERLCRMMMSAMPAGRCAGLDGDIFGPLYAPSDLLRSAPFIRQYGCHQVPGYGWLDERCLWLPSGKLW